MTDSIGSRIRSGLAWKAGSQLTLQVSRMVVALILARLLAPEDWGLAAMVLVVSGFAVVFTDNALGTALIQRRTLLEEDRSTVFWTSVGIGVVLMLAGIALSDPLARFYGEAEVAPLLAVLSVSFLVTALGTTQQALLVREMRFRRLELRLIAATVAGASVGIGIAIAGYGAWAIVAQILAEAVVSTILLWYLAEWWPSLMFSFASLRRLGGFAGNVFGENLLYQAGRNVGNLLIGRFLGASALGMYALATNIILVPFSRIAGPLQQVFFPAFSRMSDDRPRMADTWIRATRLVGVISIPALVGLAVVASDFVDVVLGPKWVDATPVIQILALVGIIQSLQTLCGEVLLALGRANWLLRFTALWFVVSLASFAVGVRWGVVGVAACYAVATVLVEPVRTYLASRALGVSPWRLVSALRGVSQAAALMAGFLLVARSALVAAGVPSAARLVILVVTGGAVYLACCLWRAPEVSSEIRSAIGGRRRPTQAVTAPIETPLERV
jgi:O-antigen/teichoic acid export membrane protein